MTQNPIPDWLKRLQENSWELELLISGGAVFTLIQFPDIFLEWMENLRYMSHYDGFGIFLLLGITGIKVLTNGFILHLLLRSFWLALVCVNYIYPQGINPRRINRNPPFATPHKEGDLQNQIMYVDRLCGLVVFMAITATLILGGLLLILVFFIALSVSLQGLLHNLAWELLGVVCVSTGFAYMVDLLVMGALRRIPYISWVLFPGFWLLDRVSLRPLYDRALVLFGSNVKRPGFWLGAGVFSIITMCTVYFTVMPMMHWGNVFDSRKYVEQLASGPPVFDGFYRDKSEKVSLISIPSDLIETNFLDVRIRYEKRADMLIGHSNPVDSLQSLAGIIDVVVDDSLYNSVRWHRTWKPGDKDPGIMTKVPIEHLANGEHLLTIKLKQIDNPLYKEQLEGVPSNRVVSRIPFWKDVQ